MDLTNTAKALEKRGFEVYVCKDSASAADRVMELVAPARSVAWGGSETLKQLGVRDLIAEAGKSFPSLYNEADCFLLSANALTADGRIVNIDGTGNRVSASIYGPGAVIFVIGRNKIVEGGDRRGNRQNQTLRLSSKLPPPREKHALRKHRCLCRLLFARPYLQGDGCSRSCPLPHPFGSGAGR